MRPDYAHWLIHILPPSKGNVLITESKEQWINNSDPPGSRHADTPYLIFHVQKGIHLKHFCSTFFVKWDLFWSSLLPGLADFSEVKPASECSEGMLWMDDRGRSVSVLVSQVDSVSLVQLSKYRGSRASVLLPPQPIAVHPGAFTSRLGCFPTLRSPDFSVGTERGWINKPDLSLTAFNNPYIRVVPLIYIRLRITRIEFTEMKVESAAAGPQRVHPIILFLYEHLLIISGRSMIDEAKDQDVQVSLTRLKMQEKSRTLTRISAMFWHLLCISIWEAQANHRAAK